MLPYQPEPLSDFRDAATEQALQKALIKVTDDLGQSYPLIIGGAKIASDRLIRSLNPSDPEQVIGLVSKASPAQAEEALQAAARSFPGWSRVPAETRSDCLLKAAAIVRRRKHEFSAWLMLEAGKSRAEADADTAEAIDFMEYYARQNLQLAYRAADKLHGIRGEANRLDYLPLGTGVVISPWNFPLAILVGMTTAAIVTGNTVVLKPASSAPVIAYRFMEVLEEAGVPAGVVNFVTGSGEEIGDALVSHPLTRFVSFTGSRDVGVRISELTARIATGQKWLKRFVGEMGGKDAILVHRDADIDAAAAGIVASAFGYSGQKCSACSRAIVHKDIYNPVLLRCVERTKALKVGDVRDSANDMGPVIDHAAMNKILHYIESARSEGTILTGGAALEGKGYFIEPTIVADLPPDSRIMQEEIFGPVLAFTKSENFDHALEIANSTEFGLTGSVYTRDRKIMDRARAEFHVGNLYINRKCTGAIVGVHPFGGFNMSGTDSKAGGPDYLLLFTQLKLTSELL